VFSIFSSLRARGGASTSRARRRLRRSAFRIDARTSDRKGAASSFSAVKLGTHLRRASRPRCFPPLTSARSHTPIQTHKCENTHAKTHTDTRTHQRGTQRGYGHTRVGAVHVAAPRIPLPQLHCERPRKRMRRRLTRDLSVRGCSWTNYI